MLEILKFIFSSFWIWLGTLILISSIMGCIKPIIRFTINKVKENKE